MIPERELDEVHALIDRISEILAGQRSEIIGCALADITAIWLAGYKSHSALKLKKFRKEVLDHHRDMIWAMLAISDELETTDE